jgi:hypothetical protein
MDNIANREAQQYVDSLDSDIKSINLSDRNITILPDLLRFYNLQRLYCSRNRLTRLSQLPNTVVILYCDSNLLTSLPILNKNFIILDCSRNRLTRLPKMNTLYTLYCSHNNLTRLPPLTDNLYNLNCTNNNLSSLPLLNNVLGVFHYWDNPICDIIYYSSNIKEVRNKVQKIYNFRNTFYMLKYKNKLRDWLWVRVREPKIRLLFSPEKLDNILNNLVNSDDEEELQTKLKDWDNTYIL